MAEGFRRWLEDRMEAAGIPSRAELARRVGRDTTTLHRWVHGERAIPYDDMVALARVLHVPRIELYQALGLLPPMSDEDARIIMDLWERADPEAKEQLVRYAQFLLREQEKHQSAHRDDPMPEETTSSLEG